MTYEAYFFILTSVFSSGKTFLGIYKFFTYNWKNCNWSVISLTW